MFAAIKKNWKQHVLKRDLLSFLDEMDRNLELFYVTDQRQFITKMFILDVWPTVKDADIVRKHAVIALYAEALMDFNTGYKAYKDYETWYTSDIKNKSPENAKKLHGMKHALDVKLKKLEALIIHAGQALEKEMVQLGYLKI